MNFGMRGHDVVDCGLEKLSETCKKYGIENIQLALKMSAEGFSEGKFSPGYAREIKKILDKNNVHVSVLGRYINPSETDKDRLEKNLTYFEENLKYAKFLDADMVGLETCFVGEKCEAEKNHTEEAYQYLLANMKRLVACAEKLGVMIGIEGVWQFVVGTPERMKRLLDDLNSPNVCVILDSVNLLTADNYQDEKSIIDRSFELYGDRIAVLHIKDYDIRDGRLTWTPIGTGKFDYKHLCETVEKYKPHITAIIENIKPEVYEESVNAIKEQCLN